MCRGRVGLCGLWRLGAVVLGCTGVVTAGVGLAGGYRRVGERGAFVVLLAGQYGSSQTVVAARLMHPSCTPPLPGGSARTCSSHGCVVVA